MTILYIDKKSPIPVYYQLKNIILEKIKSGEYFPESLIPSERELGESLNISRMTVRQALNQLVAEGILYREKGKGTFVSKAKLEQRNLMSFSDLVREKGLTPCTRILAFNKGVVHKGINELLDVNDDEKLFTMKRLRLADTMPIGIEEVYIPEKYCPNLESQDLTSSLYTLLKEKYFYTIHYADNVVEAIKPSGMDKKQLEIADTTPVLSITSIHYTESGLKLLYEKSLYRSDEYKYNIRVYGSMHME